MKQQHHHSDSVRRRSSRKKKQLLLENGSSTLSDSQTTSDHGSEADSFSGSSRTSRTSLGRSVRQGYQSYSEKFLAEQEEHKRRCLQTMAEGQPLPNPHHQDARAVGGRFLLTDGTRVAIDPSGDRCALSGMSKVDEESTCFTSKVETATYTEEELGKSKELGKSSGTFESNRKGVYGGGIKYFNPHNEEESSEDQDSYEEEVESTIPTEQEGIEVYQKHGEMATMEVDGSDMGSLFSETEEESPHYKTSGGVESVDSTMSTGYQNEMLMYRRLSNGKGSGRR